MDININEITYEEALELDLILQQMEDELYNDEIVL